jgi:predicted SAM-dependent methyltransferase
MKYHLGCGNKRLGSFINIDCIKTEAVDVVDDIATLNTQKYESADFIYACHCLEHFGRNEVLEVLKVWNSKLKVGGTLQISVPDFESVIKVYQQNRNLQEVLGLMYGGQRNEYDYHKMIFTFESLVKLLEEAGFTNAKRYDWRLTEHSHIDDYSQAYIPHMQKESGQLMSLNVEATKK